MSFDGSKVIVTFSLTKISPNLREANKCVDPITHWYKMRLHPSNLMSSAPISLKTLIDKNMSNVFTSNCNMPQLHTLPFDWLLNKMSVYLDQKK